MIPCYPCAYLQKLFDFRCIRNGAGILPVIYPVRFLEKASVGGREQVLLDPVGGYG